MKKASWIGLVFVLGAVISCKSVVYTGTWPEEVTGTPSSPSPAEGGNNPVAGELWASWNEEDATVQYQQNSILAKCKIHGNGTITNCVKVLSSIAKDPNNSNNDDSASYFTDMQWVGTDLYLDRYYGSGSNTLLKCPNGTSCVEYGTTNGWPRIDNMMMVPDATSFLSATRSSGTTTMGLLRKCANADPINIGNCTAVTGFGDTVAFGSAPFYPLTTTKVYVAPSITYNPATLRPYTCAYASGSWTCTSSGTNLTASANNKVQDPLDPIIQGNSAFIYYSESDLTSYVYSIRVCSLDFSGTPTVSGCVQALDGNALQLSSVWWIKNYSVGGNLFAYVAYDDTNEDSHIINCAVNTSTGVLSQCNEDFMAGTDQEFKNWLGSQMKVLDILPLS